MTSRNAMQFIAVPDTVRFDLPAANEYMVRRFTRQDEIKVLTGNFSQIKSFNFHNYIRILILNLIYYRFRKFVSATGA